MNQPPDTSRLLRNSVVEWVMSISGFVSLVGLWIAVSVLLYDGTAVIWRNNLSTGLAIFSIAGYDYYRQARGFDGSVVGMTFVALLGLWTLVVPFVVDVGSESLVWSSLVSGLLVSLLAVYSAYATQQAETVTGRTQT